ncbi:MAG TPA: hypothetical protein VI423_11125 [Paenisporosarcina sp.]|nr:hypothetical protein [Paenisporosarcina sp.]
MSTPVYADNCQACGQEHLSIELIPIKLGSFLLSRVKVCMGCLLKSDVYQDYKEAADLILQRDSITFTSASAAKEQL